MQPNLQLNLKLDTEKQSLPARLLVLAMLAVLALTVSGTATADKRHDRHHGQHSVVYHGKHHAHPVHKHHPRYVKGPKQQFKHHPKHPDRRYVKHHHSAPRHAPAQGFSLNVWSLSPLLSNSHRSGTSFHYHGQERCYHRH